MTPAAPMLLILALAQAAPAPSPTPSPTPSPRIEFREDVVVTAERAPQKLDETAADVSVLGRVSLGRLPAENLAEALDFVPGFHVAQAAGFGGAPIVASRGFFGGGEAEYVLLLVDGLPVGDAESGLADWRRLRTTQLERVEILHGPGSSVYGDAALGGVVQAFTRASLAHEGSASVSAASFTTAALDLGWGRALDWGHIGLAGTVSRSDGFRDHAAGDEGGGDAVLSAAVGPGRWTLAVSASRRAVDDPGALAATDAEQDPDASDPLFRFDREETNRARIGLSFLREGRLAVRGSLAFAARDAEITRTLLLLPGIGDRAHRELSTGALAGSLEADRDLGLGGRPGRLRVGVDLASDHVDTTYFDVGPTGDLGPETAAAIGTRRRLAAYVTQDWRPFERLRLTGGVRWDGIRDELGAGVPDNRHSAWSPRLGLNLRLGNGGGTPLVVHVQASRAFKSATLDQVLDPRPFPDGFGGTFTISNPELRPQRARSIEAGLRKDGAFARWSVVGYRIDVDDEVDFDVATFRYVNIGRSRHTGIETDLAVGRGGLVPEASYAWTRVESREADRGGLQLKNVPEHVLRLGLRAALPGAIAGELRFTWTAGLYLDDANAFPLEGQRVVDLRLERPLVHRLSVRLDLRNLTGQRYQEVGFVLPDFRGNAVPFVFPAPGFAWRVGLVTTF
jgi:outer membrane receptor protein involved in Fe transport